MWAAERRAQGGFSFGMAGGGGGPHPVPFCAYMAVILLAKLALRVAWDCTWQDLDYLVRHALRF